MGIFDVHDLIADIVGRFDQIYQRVAAITDTTVGNTQHTQFVGDTDKVFPFRCEKAQLSFFSGQSRLIGIFYDRSQCRVGHDKSPFAPAFEFMGQQAECVGVSFEMGEVFPLIVVEGKCFFQSQSVSFREIGGNGFFTRVSERGISQVVCQTCCRNDRTDPVELVDPCFVFIFFGEGCRYVVSQRPAYA